MNTLEVLSELYAVRREVEKKAYWRFERGIGYAYPDELRKLDEQIAQIKKRTPGVPSVDFTLTSPPYDDASGESKNKTVVHVDGKKGIYIDEKRRYPISGKRLECVEKLLESDSLTTEDLEQFWSTSSQISNEIKEINTQVRKKLEIRYDLIIHSKSARSYSLNQEELDIRAS